MSRPDLSLRFCDLPARPRRSAQGHGRVVTEYPETLNGPLYGLRVEASARPLDGADLRLRPLSERRALLAGLLKDAPESLRLSEHLDGSQGAVMFEHASQMGLEGIVSKRTDSLYRSGRTAKWLKIKAAGYQRRPA